MQQQPAIASTELAFLREQLQERRRRLEAAIATMPAEATLTSLLAEVDAALERMAAGGYGICEVCHESVEKDRLLMDPLARLCLDHLTAPEQRALERDLELAAQVQRKLLPQPELRAGGWEARFCYQPAGVVSGDYCDLIPAADGSGRLFFVLGDVAGKGVAASMVMTQLHAIFRSLAQMEMPLDQVLGLANRIFCESALAGQYATMICGRAHPDGAIELHNAGHWPALVARGGKVTPIESTGVPLGMFCSMTSSFAQTQLAPGDTLFLYTDGLLEARNGEGAEFGSERLRRLLAENCRRTPQELAALCLEQVGAFSRDARADDAALLILRRS